MSSRKRIRVYVAGPMTGHKDFNYPAFFAAAERLEAAGYRVANPAAAFNGDTTRPYAEYLAKNIRELTKCHAIALLDGWLDSRGASCEAHIARVMGMQRVCPYTCAPLPAWVQAA